MSSDALTTRIRWYWFDTPARHVSNYLPIVRIALVTRCQIIARTVDARGEVVECRANSFLEMLVFMGTVLGDEPYVEVDFVVSGENAARAVEAIRRFGELQKSVAPIERDRTRRPSDAVKWFRAVEEFETWLLKSSASP